MKKPSREDHVHEPRWPIVIVLLVLAAATFLLCEIPRASGRPAAPSVIARLLMFPVVMPGMSDLRNFVLPLGLIALLIGIALRPAAALAGGGHLKSFVALSLVVAVAALVSAYLRQTWELSSGWIFQFAVGAAWALMIAYVITPGAIGKLMAGAGLIGIFAMMTSMWHRLVLGELFFEFPVGPITLTSELGAFWAACGLVFLVSELPEASGKRSPGRIALAFLVVVSGIVLMTAANRRASWLGFTVACGFAFSIAAWRRYPSRRARVGIIAALATVALATGLMVAAQFSSSDYGRRLPLTIRLTYWKKMLAGIANSPVLGQGPDMFVCRMTSDLAKDRADMPRVYHGTVDFDGHNEWLQAAYEIGVPGGIAYFLIPLTCLWMALRRRRSNQGQHENAALLVCCAGLVAICVSESASINLRHPIIAAYFWTMVGMTLALCRVPAARASASARIPGTPIRFVSVLVGAVIAFVVIVDFGRTHAHGAGKAGMMRNSAQAVELLDVATRRMGAAPWLLSRVDLATTLSNALRESRRTATTQAAASRPADADTRAVTVWSEVFNRCPGFVEVGFRLAEAQWLAGGKAAAKATLDRYLQEISPYDRQANLLRIALGGLSVEETTLALRRALRGSALDSFIFARAAEVFGDSQFAARWQELVAVATRNVAEKSEAAWSDPLAPETLRLESLRLATNGDLAGALAMQLSAARVYDILAVNNSSFRRTAEAEADAWYLAARMQFDSDPGTYAEAYAFIQKAEQFSALRVAMEPGGGGLEPAGVNVGQMKFGQRTPEQRQLYELSAKIRWMMNRPEREVDLRFAWSLAESQAAPARLQAAKRQAAAELLEILRSLPPERRPPGYRHIAAFVR